MALPVVAAAIGGLTGTIQSLIGSGQIKRGNRELNRLFSQRQAYQTPQEIFDILNLTQFNAAQGFSDETMSYLTNEAGAGLASSLGAATKLGADPNNLSALVDNYYKDIFKIGGENELQKLKKFDSLTNAIQLVAQGKDAEWQSEENILKDRMQAAASKVAGGQANLQSGLNATISSMASLASMGLYNKKPQTGGGVDASTVPATVPANTAMNFSIGNQVGPFRRTA